MTQNIGFIGVGFMGLGIAKNLIKHSFKLKIIAHINRVPIKKLLSLGAEEVENYENLSKNIDCLFICVTNTPIAIEIAKKIAPMLPKDSLIIDITTHQENGSIQIIPINKL